MMRSQSSTEDGKYKVSFLKVLKTEMDRQMQISEKERSKT